MKFDSYPRFLRSELYRACLEAGSAIVDTEDCDLHLTSSPSVKLKKSHSDAEDRCRKSILPWNRKNRYITILFIFIDERKRLLRQYVFYFILLHFQIQIERSW